MAIAPDNRNGTPPPRDGPALRVLVVDDSPDTAETFALLVRLMGHEAVMAHSGPAALEEARANPPDVVLLDIGLPGMDGWEVGRRLRAQAGPRPLMLAAVTGYGQPEDRRRSAEAGFDLHLLKPVDVGELTRLLDRARQAAGGT